MRGLAIEDAPRLESGIIEERDYGENRPHPKKGRRHRNSVVKLKVALVLGATELAGSRTASAVQRYGKLVRDLGAKVD